jgi:hypothetical protein
MAAAEISKYTPEQIRQMALTTMAALAQHDPRGLELVMTLSFATGIDPNECIDRIKELAHGPEEDIRSAA